MLTEGTTTRLPDDEEPAAPRVDRVPPGPRTPWGALHYLSLVLGFAAEWWLLRGTWFRGDDFEFLANRVGPDPLLGIWAPHNEHWSTGPILIWRLFYSWVGIGSSDLYFAASLLMHVLTAHFVWRLMLRAGGHPGVATGLAASFVLLGAGWENITWAFQVGFMGSSALGLAALLLCLRGSGRAAVAAVVLLLVSLTFSGVSITFVLASALALALQHRWRTTAALVVSTGGTYILWYLAAGHDAEIPTHPTGRLDRAAGAADWAWTVFTSAVGSYTSMEVAGAVLFAALVAFLVTHVRRMPPESRTVDGARRSEVVVLAVSAATAAVMVASFAVNRSDISPPDSPRYLYFVIALLMPLFCVALTALQGWIGRVATAAILVYLVVTQSVVLVEQERTFENPQIRADVLGLGRLIGDGEPVSDVTLFSYVTTGSITRWVDQDALGPLDDVDPQYVLDARAIGQVAVTSEAPAAGSAAEVLPAGSTAPLAAGTCATVSAAPGGTAAVVGLDGSNSVRVRLEDAGSLVYRVTRDGGSSRTVGAQAAPGVDRYLTASVPLVVEVVADSGQRITFCVD